MQTHKQHRLVLSILGFGLAAMVSTGAMSASTWKEIGPNPVSGGDAGRVTDIAPHPTNGDTLFVATASGGAWRYDSGKWTAMTDELSMLATGAIAVDPQDPDVLYLGGGEPNYAPHCFYGNGIFKSTDGGKSWSNVGEKVSGGRAVSSIVVSSQNSELVYAAVQRAGGSDVPDAARHHPHMERPVGVYRTRDAGKTWSLVEGLPKGVGATDLVISPKDDSVVYVGLGDRVKGSKHGAYRSKDGGKTWKKLNLPGVGSNVGRVSLAISKSDPDNVYVLVAAGTPSHDPRQAKILGLWRSQDGGESFRRHNPGRISSGFGWFMLVAGIHPTDPAQVAVGSINLVRSSDGGGRFSDISPPHPDVHAIVWDAKGRMVVGDDGGVHRSSSNGRRWESLNKGLGTIQFYPALALHPTNANWILGGLQDNGTVLWNGSSWRRVIGGDGGYAALHPDQPQVVLGQSQHTGNLMRSTNGGRSFRASSSGIDSDDRDAFFNPVIFDPHDPNVAYYATQRIYKSTNQGQSWRAISKDLTDGAHDSAVRTIDMSKSESGIIYVVTTDGRVLISEDGGSNFKISLQDVTDWKRVSRDLVVSTRTPDVAYLGVPRFNSSIGQVVKTTDRGKTWTDITGDLPNIPVSSIEHYADPDSDGEGDILFAGTDNQVYISCDDGEHWVPVGGAMANALATELRYQPQFKRVVVGTMGRGVWLMESASPDELRTLCEEGPEEEPEKSNETEKSSPDPEKPKTPGDPGGSNKTDKPKDSGEPKANQTPEASASQGDLSDGNESGEAKSGDSPQDGDEGGCSTGGSGWSWSVFLLVGVFWKGRARTKLES